MRSPSAKNNTLFFILTALTLSACGLFTKNQEAAITGNWTYISVTRNDTALFAIGSDDSMILRADHSFCYDIAAPDKHSCGTWQLESENGKTLLVLNYRPEIKVRKFEISELKSSKLVFSENGVVFSYKRRNR